MLRVAFLIVLLSVIMLGVILLNVVAPPLNINCLFPNWFSPKTTYERLKIILTVALSYKETVPNLLRLILALKFKNMMDANLSFS